MRQCVKIKVWELRIFQKLAHLLAHSKKKKNHIRYPQSPLHMKQISSNHGPHIREFCLSKMSARQPFSRSPSEFPKALVRPRLMDLRWCNPSLWIKTCEYHQDSSNMRFSAKISAKSSIRMHMGPGLFLHLSASIFVFFCAVFWKRLCASEGVFLFSNYGVNACLKMRAGGALYVEVCEALH